MHEEQKQLVVNEFIRQFLTPNERFYKNEHTELNYLLETVRRIFAKFLGWQSLLDRSMLEVAFLVGGFRFHEVQDGFHIVNGLSIPFTYVNVMVKEIVPLRSLLADLSEQANDNTRGTYELLLQRLQVFKEAQRPSA